MCYKILRGKHLIFLKIEIIRMQALINQMHKTTNEQELSSIFEEMESNALKYGI